MENKKTNENWQGINTKGGTNTFENTTVNIYQNSQHKPKTKPNLTEQEIKELYCQFLQ